MNRWDDNAIEYTDVEALKEALVGREVLHVTESGEGYQKVLTFVLDDGTLLKAHATDGGCACSNGCFTVDTGTLPLGTILNVEVAEEGEEYGWDAPRVIEPGSLDYGSTTIRIFVYTELGRNTLVESEGGDNGYYGWGFWLSVEKPIHTKKED